ncbi:MAG: peptidylprolyl isomerase [Planctomycetota bacterium]
MARAPRFALLFGLLSLGTAPPAAPQGGEDPSPPTPAPEAEEADAVVARGRGLAVRASEVIPVLIDRYAAAPDGRGLLKLLVSSRLIELIAREQAVAVSAAEVTARWEEMDRQTRAEGVAGGLAAALAERGLGTDEFREYLRLILLQEELTRRALAVGRDVPITADQQEIWLAQEMEELGLSWPPPPWPDGIAARCGPIAIGAAELGAMLLDKLDPKDVRETCWHLLLRKGIEKRLPDLAPAARGEAVDAEMERRRREAEAGAAAQAPGVRFEELLVARGSSLELLRRDPSVHVAALTRLWVDQVEGRDGVREEYVANRDRYEGLYGRAVHTYLIFLVAAQFSNELNRRTFAAAEAELKELAKEISTLREFTAASARRSEEESVRENRGDLGWVTRDDPRFPAPIRAAVFEYIGTGGTIPPAGCTLGPVRLDTGVVLLWLSAVKESPPWEEMYEHVHEELRRRFIEDVMPVKAVEMVVR